MVINIVTLAFNELRKIIATIMANSKPNQKRFERMAETWNDLTQPQAGLDGENPAQKSAQEGVQESVQEGPVTPLVEP